MLSLRASSAPRSLLISVSVTGPGQIAFTRTPLRAASAALYRVSPSKPAFAAAYDDPAAPPLIHSRQHQLAQQKCRAQMHSQHSVELFDWILFDRHHWSVMAAVVHKNIHATERCDRLFERRSAIRFVCQIAGNERRFSSTLRNLLSSCGQFFFRTCRQKHHSTLCRK